MKLQAISERKLFQSKIKIKISVSYKQGEKNLFCLSPDIGPGIILKTVN